MYTTNDDFAIGFFQFIKPTWPPISLDGRERAHAGAARTLANAAAWGPCEKPNLPRLEPSSETQLRKNMINPGIQAGIGPKPKPP